MNLCRKSDQETGNISKHHPPFFGGLAWKRDGFESEQGVRSNITVHLLDQVTPQNAQNASDKEKSRYARRSG